MGSTLDVSEASAVVVASAGGGGGSAPPLKRVVFLKSGDFVFNKGSLRFNDGMYSFVESNTRRRLDALADAYRFVDALMYDNIDESSFVWRIVVDATLFVGRSLGNTFCTSDAGGGGGGISGGASSDGRTV